MTSTTPTIQFFAGVAEDLTNVSLRKNPQTGKRIVVMIFERIKALEGFKSFTKQSLNSMLLTDEEGEIQVTPTSTKFIFGGDEGDELRQVECKVEIEQDEHWERFMRFMHRYADANGMAYKEGGSDGGKE
ncbi:MAG: photosystem II reaction center protein Psb28 [Calothrix sp. MO_167.B12]|nr:photosystem II reaction center protein Psb28 [Calothrix sp. MO_167.B12]